MTDALTAYHARMLRVLDHIDRHLDEPQDVETLAGVAAFSKHHFHRQFSALFGIGVARYVQLLRMKRAAYQLAYRESSVTEIALDTGYEAPESFTRAFRTMFGQAPGEFRKLPAWETWLLACGPLANPRSFQMNTPTPNQVEIVETTAVSVAVMTHRGDPARIGDTIQRFIAWRRATGLTPRVSATYNIFHSDPATTPAAEYRLDLCAATNRPVAPNDAGVVEGEIPSSRAARLTLTGSSDDLGPAADWLYREWLPASGEEPRDFPFYCRRVSFFPDVPEHEAVTELYLPLV